MHQNLAVILQQLCYSKISVMVLVTCLNIFPFQEMYCPPLTIRVVDCRSFGRFTLVGTHVINSIHKFLYQPITKRDREAAAEKKKMVAASGCGKQKLRPIVGTWPIPSADGFRHYFLSNGQPRPLFRLFLVLSNKQYKFYNKSMWKNAHPVFSAGIQTHNLLNISHLS